DALRSTFGAMGIPCQISTTHTLASTGLGATLLALLSGADNWARETVLDLLHSPWLHGHLGGPIPQPAAYYVRTAAVRDGSRHWSCLLGELLRQLERGSGRDARGVLPRHPNAVREVQGLLAAVALVEALQQRLPKKGTQYDFAVA